VHVLLIHYWVKCGKDVLITYRRNSNLATFGIYDCVDTGMTVMKLCTLDTLTLIEVCRSVHLV